MTALYILPELLIQWMLPLLPGLRTLGQWAVSASALILLVLGVRLLLRRRLSCRLVYALWAVVLVRLLLPFQLSLPLPVSASQAAPSVPPSWDETWVPLFPSLPQNVEDAHPYYQALEPGYSGRGPWSQGYVERSEDGETVITYLDCFTQTDILRLVWGAGVLAVLLTILVSNLRFTIRLEEKRRALEVSGCPLPVYEAEGLPSPCLFGLFHPAIYLTPEAAQLPEGQRRHILAHELTHHRHRDHLWAALRCLALALHWYNPLVWLAVLVSKRDGELACDEGTVERLGEGERIPYGRTLVDLVARRSLRPGDFLSCSTAMTGGKKTIQRRIAQLVKQPETKKTALFLAVALAALGLVFTFGTQVKTVDTYTEFCRALGQETSFHFTYVASVDGARQGRDMAISDSGLVAQLQEHLSTGSTQEEVRGRPSEDASILRFDSLDRLCFYLEEVQNGCELIRYDTRHPESGRLLAILPGGTTHVLERLAQQQLQQDAGERKNLLQASTREAFLSGLEKAAAVTLSLPPLSSAGLDPIVDEDLLGQVREVLGQAEAWDRDNSLSFGFQDMAPYAHTVYFLTGEGTYAFCLYSLEGGGDYVLSKLEDGSAGAEPLAVLPQGTISRLEELARQQQERNQSLTRVEYPEFKAALTKLFLGDEECVRRNQTEDYDMEEWLTQYTSFYEISHAAPWWLEGAEEGWYARAMDAGSWYSISIPGHLAPQVQAICEEQALYPSLDTVYSALEQTDTICYAAMSAMSFHSVIRDPELLEQITRLLLTPRGNMAQVSDPGRTTVGEEFGVFTIPLDEEHQLNLWLQEVEGSCLLSCGRADDTWSGTQPVLWTLPAGTAQEIYDLYMDWLMGKPQSDSAPDYDWQGELALDTLPPGEEVLSSSPVTVPAGGGGFTYHITYARASLTLEVGLRAEDGTEYLQRVVGGSLANTIPDIPAGTYQLFVRNSGDYDFQATGYLSGDVDYNVTGALVFLVEPASGAAASPQS